MLIFGIFDNFNCYLGSTILEVANHINTLISSQSILDFMKI
uniref:Uncharacterized protein n=1 Tax=Tetranychus urticae TaxID=32264 RepID=T1K1E3_TETUR